jgi:hypothetical protein
MQGAAAQGTPVSTGSNSYGQLGHVDSETTTTLSTYGAGSIRSWGHNYFGQLGDGTNNNTSTPTGVIGLENVRDVKTGRNSNLALKNDGTVWGWGTGQLGNGTYASSHNVPVQASGLTGVTAIAASYQHGLALKSDGTVWAWGLNWKGEFGDGTYNNSNVPVQSSGFTGVTAIAAGDRLSLALKSDGTVWACGYNYYGQLGDATNNNSNVPVQVSGLTGISAIASSSLHSLALKNDGTVWAWGYNEYGQLGDGTTNNSNVPLQVPGFTGVSAIAAGDYHSLTLRSNGAVWAWGYNEYGQLGDGTTNNSNVPVQVSGLNGMTKIVAGAYHSLAFIDYNEKIAPTITITAPLNNAVVAALPDTIGGTTGDNLGVSNVRLVRWRLSGKIGGVTKYWDATNSTWNTSSVLNSTSPVRPSSNPLWSAGGSLPRDNSSTGGVDNLPGGSYSLTAYANDRTNRANITHNFTVDKVAPTLTISAPLTNNAVITALPANISGTVTDNIGVSNVTLVRWRLSGTVDGATKYWNSSTGVWVTASNTLNTASPARPSTSSAWSSMGSLPRDNSSSGGVDALPQGRYILTAYANDKAGKSSSLIHSFLVDKTAPTITISAPLTRGAFISALPTNITGTVGDNAGISNVTLVRWRLSGTVDGVLKFWNSTTGAWVTTSTLNSTSPTRPSTSSTWSSTGTLPQDTNLPNGNYALTAYVNDKAGKSANITHSFTVSKPAGAPVASPSETVTSTVIVSSGVARAASQSVLLSFSGALHSEVATEAAHYTVEVDGQLVEVESLNYDATIRRVTLGLIGSTFGSGSGVVVTVSGLRDAQGRVIKEQKLQLKVN